MSAELEEIAILDYFTKNWPATFGPLIPPNHAEPTASSSIHYAALIIMSNPDARTRNSIGAPRLIRNRGFILVTQYCPKDKGKRILTQMTDWIRDNLDERVFSLSNGQKVVCGISGTTTLGNKDNLFREITSIPYHRDEWKN